MYKANVMRDLSPLMIRSAFVIQSQIYPKAALVVGRGLADGGSGLIWD